VWAGLHDRARPDGFDGFPVVHPYVVHYVLGYHQAAFPGGPPGSWDALLDPRHRGRIALYPGGHGLYPIAQVMGGGDVAGLAGPPAATRPCWSWLRRLSGNMISAGGTGGTGHLAYSIGMADQLREGRLDLVMRALPNVLAFLAEGLPVGWTVPREGTSDTVDALWIPRGVPPDRAALAMRYVAFALRADIQERWCGQLGVLPVHRAAAAPALLREHPRLPGRADGTDGILYLPEAVKARHQPGWEAEFRRLFGGP
jgi:putative spermidine/putrescine transport system substrate-binding protein